MRVFGDSGLLWSCPLESGELLVLWESVSFTAEYPHTHTRTLKPPRWPPAHNACDCCYNSWTHSWWQHYVTASSLHCSPQSEYHRRRGRQSTHLLLTRSWLALGLLGLTRRDLAAGYLAAAGGSWRFLAVPGIWPGLHRAARGCTSAAQYGARLSKKSKRTNTQICLM